MADLYLWVKVMGTVQATGKSEGEGHLVQRGPRHTELQLSLRAVPLGNAHGVLKSSLMEK